MVFLKKRQGQQAGKTIVILLNFYKLILILFFLKKKIN